LCPEIVFTEGSLYGWTRDTRVHTMNRKGLGICDCVFDNFIRVCVYEHITLKGARLNAIFDCGTCSGRFEVNHSVHEADGLDRNQIIRKFIKHLFCIHEFLLMERAFAFDCKIGTHTPVLRA
jgi:hypothetical protein